MLPVTQMNRALPGRMPGETVKSIIWFCSVSVFLLIAFSSSGASGLESIVLGHDDLTRRAVVLRTGKSHPFVAWTKEEVDSFRSHLLRPEKIYDGTRYAWTSVTGGTSVKAAQGDPMSCAKVWQVTGELKMARKAASYLLEKSASFEEKDFLKNEWQAPAELQTSALIYDLIAEGEALAPAEKEKIRQYLRTALYSLKKLVSYGMIHNIGMAIDQGAWTAALSLEDEEMLKELLQRFKKTIGAGLLPGGYWYEGTAYGDMVRTNLKEILERADRSGIDLAHLHCKRKALSPNWQVPEGYLQAGEIFDWPFHVVTPFMEMPNIADGNGPRKVRGYSVLTVGKYVKDRKFVDRLYIWDKGINKDLNPHVWGDFPPDPDVAPLERLEDTINPDLGMFIFRHGTGLDPDDQYVLFLTLPRTGFHMHSDQGHVSIVRYGRWLTGDVESSAKSTGYQQLRDAFSATRWAHNAVVIGGQWGKREIDFPKVNYVSRGPSAPFKVADVTMNDVTNGPTTTHRRRLIVTDNFIVLADDLTSPESTTFDWFFHGANNAAWSFDKREGGSVTPFISYIPPHSVPDQDLVWDGAYETRKPWSGTFLVDEKEGIGLKVWQMDVDRGLVSSGHLIPPKHGDPGLYEGERLYLVCQRKEGREGHFTAVIEPFRRETRIEGIQLLENTPDKRKLRITFKNKTSQIVSIGEGEYLVN